MASGKREPRIIWQIEEYSHREKGPDWFWALGVVALAGAAIAVIYHDTFFAVFIIISAVMLGYFAARPPEIMEVAISDEGISVKNILYLFEKIKGFAVEEHDLGNRLILETERVLAPIFSIPLPATLDTDSLAELLRTKIVEKPLKEKASHRIMEHLGF